MKSFAPLLFLPDVPPIADTVPAATPRTLAFKLGSEYAISYSVKLGSEYAYSDPNFVRTREFGERLAREGAVAVGNTPDQFDAVIRADIAKWSKVIKAAKIRPD